jgi:hypothetical protein
MALPILDGNQSATTLSSILTSGEHIPAHTVVSLGTQAITDISGAVSGSVVSISNFPATQTIAGTVTANLSSGTTANPIYNYILEGDNDIVIGNTNPLPISGTVTANAFGFDGPNSEYAPIPLNDGASAVNVSVVETNGSIPIAGTVTIGNSVTIGSLPLIAGTVTVGNSLSIQSGNISIEEVFGENSFVPISGTVTVGNSVTIASFATSVTARLINPAGTAVTYAEVGTAGSPSIDVLSVQGVTAGSPVITTLLLSSTAITSGSFTSLASATLVPGNTARKMATVYNLGAGQLFVNAGATATTLGGGFMVALSSGDFYECDYTTTTLSAIFATAGTASWMSH